MATNRRRINKGLENTGFGTNSNVEGKRLTNKDGSINLQKTGIPFWQRVSLYHTILRLPRWKFFLSVFAFYTAMNFFFATVYVIIGVENLQGVNAGDSEMAGFLQAFFFSSQTLTTVGYGHISPVGFWANVVASLESFIGILSFALVTGLLYGRFTRPKAYIRFSDNVLVAPHKGGRALMVRLATYKNNHLTDVEARMNVAMHIQEGGKKVTRFYGLNLEITNISSLALNWTLVHQINEDSPLYQMSYEDMMEAKVEILVFIKGFDDHFANVVQQRTSYLSSEIVYGAKFLPMYRSSEDGTTTVLELSRINAYEQVAIPETEISGANA